jgi:hypothetical protein
MARFTYGMRATVVGTAARSMMSIYAPASSGFRLREVGIFNTTTTALAVALVRHSATGTQGAAQTEGLYDPGGVPPLATIFAGHTADATVSFTLRQATLGAAAGAGIIWTFGDSGIVVPLGTTNGLGISCPTGTGQLCDLYFDWEE